MKKNILFCLIIVVGFFSAQAKDQLGELKFNDLLLQSTAFVREPTQGGFYVKKSYLSFLWQNQSEVSGQFKLGTLDLRQKPRFFDDSQDQNEFGLIEAWISTEGGAGSLMVGLIPIVYGYEGAQEESKKSFPDSSFYQSRWIPQTDFGIFWKVRHKGFSSIFQTFNGESGEDLDQSMWYAGRWTWENPSWAIGFSGVLGRTSPDSTALSESTEIDFDEQKSAKIRLLNFFLKWEDQNLLTVFEGHFGEIFQGDHKSQLTHGRIDFVYRWFEDFHVLMRYEDYDLNWNQAGDNNKVTSIGLALLNHFTTSNFYFLASHKDEEHNQMPNDEFWIVWRINPFYK